MAFLNSLDIVGSALTAERFRADVALQNMANANTVAPPDETPYRRRQVIFQERPLSFDDELTKAINSGGVRVANVVDSNRDFKVAYDPTHPYADEDGYIHYSNVDTTEEMIDLMAASNAYDANLTALEVLKAMVSKTLEIGN